MQIPKYLATFLTCFWFLGDAVQAETFIPFGTPKIDGVVSSAEWSPLSHVRMARLYGADQYSDLWLQWDENNLYVAGIMQDKTLWEDGVGGGNVRFTETWHDDSLEIYFQPTQNLSELLDESARIIAFTPTGKFQRIDRGRWAKDTDTSLTNGLETFANSIAKINDAPFFNQNIFQTAYCPLEQPTFGIFEAPVGIQYKHSQTPNVDWRFELAIPWRLLGTKIDTKVVGLGCQLGSGVYPTKLAVRDGVSLALNFFRVGDDDGNDATPGFTGTIVDSQGNKSANGILKDEWTVFQGDRFHPKEWMRFVLSDQRQAALGPYFADTSIRSESVSAVDGRRARLRFSAAQRSSKDTAPVKRYVVRYTEGERAIDTNLWKSLSEYPQAVAPVAAGSEQRIDVTGLQPGKTYSMGVRAVDELGNESQTILTTQVTLPKDTRTFVAVAPTGHGLVLSDGKPFVVAGETSFIALLPLRGLYDQEICEESPPEFLKSVPANFGFPKPKACGQGVINRLGKPINGLFRNYSSENIFYTCFFTDGSQKNIAVLTPTDKPKDFCAFQEARVLDALIKNNPAAVEGPQVAEAYFAKLKANNINTLTLFVEYLHLDATPIMFEPNNSQNNATNEAILRFLDNLLELGRKYNVYIMLRLYDDFYYKDGAVTGSNRKWSDTFWYKQLGKKFPENFFDADIYSYHQKRMQVLLERYKDHPNVLGWDLLNEIDNKIRFNSASLESRKKWLDSMLAYAKSIDKNHLMFYSFLTWDPKDDSFYRKGIGEQTELKQVITLDNSIGMDATVAYRLPNADLSVPHGYYAHVANPWESGGPDYSAPLELARGISYGFHHIQDGRPIIDGESGPGTFSFQKFYGDDGFTEAQDNLNFYRSAWLHFISGGAGANLRWPSELKKDANEQVNQISDTQRGYLKVFMSEVGSLRWRGDALTINQLPLPNASSTQFIRTDEQSALVYVYNTQSESLQNLNLSYFATGLKGDVKVLNPANGEILYQQVGTALASPITLKKAVQQDVVVIITHLVDEQETSQLASDYTLTLPHVVYTDSNNTVLNLAVKLKLFSNQNGKFVFQLQEYSTLPKQSISSQTVKVDQNFLLTLPRLVFEFNGAKKFFNATLQGNITGDKLYFEVLNYAEI